ncbi:hypothetical protein [Paraburkholderia sp. EG304]|uniref:hypothetical protein n=1 Tax=Paraburkholderia sp. EG304 TaxID=3237015 RepID=UPI00397D5A61
MAVTIHYPDGTVKVIPTTRSGESEPSKKAVTVLRERRKSAPKKRAYVLRETLDRLDHAVFERRSDAKKKPVGGR